MWIQMCGFTHSVLTTLPFNVTGLFASNSAANEWCAMTGTAVATSSAAPTITTNKFLCTGLSPARMVYGTPLPPALRLRRTIIWRSLRGQYRPTACAFAKAALAWRLLRRLLFQVAVEQLLGEFDALVLEKLGLRLEPSVDGHPDRPGPDKRVRVLDPRLVVEMVSARPQRIALRDHERIAVMIAGPVKPGLIVEAVHADDKRVALPLAVRPSHPAVHRGLGVVDH